MNLKELLQKVTDKDLDTYINDYFPNKLVRSDTLKESFGLTDREIEELYHQGYLYYQQDLYDKCRQYFEFCVILDPFITKYWMALGATQQLVKDLDKALHSYAIAAYLDPDDPFAHFHAYECLEALNNKCDAQKALKLAYKNANKVCYAHLKSKIERMIANKATTL